MRWMLLITISILLISGFTFAVDSLKKVPMPMTSEEAQPITDVIESMLIALKLNDTHRAYFAFTSKQFQQATSFDQFKEFAVRYPEFGKFQSITFQDKHLAGDIATFTGTLTTQDGTTSNIKFDLIRENLQWKIMGMQMNPGNY